MKSQFALSLILLFFATGCADSTVPQDAARTTDGRASKDKADAQHAIRERPVVKLTDAAVSKFKEVLAAEPTKHIRLSIKNEGPTGFMYDLQIDDTIHESDFVDQSQGITLVVDARSSIFLEGATIDWQIQPDGQAGFKFENPNAVEQ